MRMLDLHTPSSLSKRAQTFLSFGDVAANLVTLEDHHAGVVLGSVQLAQQGVVVLRHLGQLSLHRQQVLLLQLNTHLITLTRWTVSHTDTLSGVIH